MGYNDPYKKLESEWESYGHWIKDCKKFLDELQYDGFETNCYVTADKLSSYPSNQLITEHPVNQKLFILPHEYNIIPVESFVRQPPVIPAVKPHPRIKLSDSEYPK